MLNEYRRGAVADAAWGDGVEFEWAAYQPHGYSVDRAWAERAEELRDYLKGTKFDAVFVSPMQRARETCAIAGFGDRGKLWTMG